METFTELDKTERAAVNYRTAYDLRESVLSAGDNTENNSFCSIEVTNALPLLACLLLYLLTYSTEPSPS